MGTVWVLSFHSSLTGDSFVDVFADYGFARGVFDEMMHDDKEACDDPFDEASWREWLTAQGCEYWYDNGDITCTVRLEQATIRTDRSTHGFGQEVLTNE